MNEQLVDLHITEGPDVGTFTLEFVVTGAKVPIYVVEATSMKAAATILALKLGRAMNGTYISPPTTNPDGDPI